MLSELRLRLTLMYLLIGLSLVAALSGVTYGLLRYYFQSSTDQALKLKMGLQFIELKVPIPADLYKSISTSGLMAVDSITSMAASSTTVTGQMGSDESETSHRLLEESELADIFVLPLTIQGLPVLGNIQVISSSQIDPQAFQQALKYGSDLRTIKTSEGTLIRVLTYRVPSASDVAAIQVGKSLQPEMDVLMQLLRGLILIGLGSVIFIGVGAWILSGKSIQPAAMAFEKQREFVANASHELRAPLTLIHAGIEVAKRESDNSQRQQVLDDTLVDADYMKHLLDDLLLLSRLDSRMVTLDKNPVQFPEFLEMVTRKMSMIASQSGIELTGESEAFELMADPNRLQQVIFILVDNAIRHNTPGGWVKVTARKVQTQVLIEVRDSGKGIPQEHLDRVFERFYKVEDGSRSAQKGSGLGLSIARGLVEAHRGKIKLASKPGKGTNVTVSLPIGSKPASLNP